MSPEQASGERVDHRTDVFSLGAVLYEMVAGQRAFPGPSLAAIAAVIHQEPTSLTRTRAGVPRSLETVVRRCLAKSAAERFASAGAVQQALDGVADEISGSGRSSRTTRWLGAAGVALAGVILIGVLTRGPGSGAVRTIAVLPFGGVEAEGPDGYALAGLTSGITAELSQIASLRVVSFADTTRPLADLGRDLQAVAVLTGQVTRIGDSLELALHLVDPSTSATLWLEEVTGALADLSERTGSLALAISERLSAPVESGTRVRVQAHRTVDRDASDAYLRGRFALEQGDLEIAHLQFDRAVSLEPEWAPPHAGLAAYWSSLSFFSDLPPVEILPNARTEARRALDLDDNLAEAHAALAYIRAYFEWDWREAEVEFQRALALQPSYPQAMFSYARFMASRGRLDEAIAMTRRAVEFDPLSLELKANLALLHYFAGRYDEALGLLEEVRAIDPDYPLARWAIGLVLEQQGKLAEAIPALSRTGGSMNRLSSLGHALGVAGRDQEARAVLDTLTARAGQQYVPAYFFALVHAGLGEAPEALRWLERAYEERSSVLAYLRIDPRLAALRDEPAFRALVTRIWTD